MYIFVEYGTFSIHFQHNINSIEDIKYLAITRKEQRPEIMIIDKILKEQEFCIKKK